MKLVTYVVLVLFIASCKSNEKKEYSQNSNISDSLVKQTAIMQDTILINEKGDSLIFEFGKRTILFSDKIDGRWKTLQVSKELDSFRKVSGIDDNITFERNNKSDFSPNRNYLLLHAIEKGNVSNGDTSFVSENYYCIFLDIDKVEVSNKQTGLLCSGAWQSPCTWVIDEENYNCQDLFKL